ncbi:MAG: methylmalonyl-CoA mutase [Pelagibacteraceae bacterium TMED237]|nr:methylmalonyl-CoA mutase [Candidatus Neomarinimicrobiota bacterium]OUW96302.1 MAG: methylmalonyl-CoA mutase [Pelagibacteraceae bacterium TMED237]|tara:strand:+ start:2365 stop:3888 length:1524 start_codon:yes stop_codon:yes gene_type:complete
MTKKKFKKFYGSIYDETPGQYPFTHGIYADMYTNRKWTMRQYAGFSSAHESNKRYQFLLNEGVTGLSVAFDLPTQTGYDSDSPLAIGEVGKVGVPICTIDDMRILLSNIPLDKVSISMTINSTAAILLGFLIVIAKEQNLPIKKLKGTIQNDILKEYIARGTYIYPPNQSMQLVTDVFEYCSKNMPKWNTISISGYHMREAGCNAIQELAFTFSNAISYVDNAINRGLDPNIFGQQLSFFFNGHNNFFEEISKFRAARRIWAQLMKKRFNVSNKKALMCRFHVQTAGSTLTAQQPDNNIVRTSMQALSAIIGGAQSIHTNSKDEALSLPTEESAETALRTQQIIAHESGVPDIIDPLSGSFFIEDLTNQIEKETLNLIKKIDDLGGAIEAIKINFQDKEISTTAYNYQQSVENGNNIIVGVNKYKNIKEPSQKILKMNPDITADQLKRLKKFKNNRDSSITTLSLKKLKNAAIDSENLMPFIIEAIESKATLGEISSTLKEVYGEHS